MTTQRETYSLFDLFGDVGGFLEFLRVFGKPFISFFSAAKLLSLVANRLYTWRPGSSVQGR